MHLKLLRTPLGGPALGLLLACTCSVAATRTGVPDQIDQIDQIDRSGHDDAYVYRLPYVAGASFPVLQAYGSRFSHRGTEYYTVDFRMKEGTPVFSSRGGVVLEIENAQVAACWSEGCGRYANRVVIRHSDGSIGRYFHLEAGSVVVRPGQNVVRGDLLARSGNTGLTTTPHLHFGVYVEMPDGSMQSIPVRFDTSGGPVEPRPGRRYMHPAVAQTAWHGTGPG